MISIFNASVSTSLLIAFKFTHLCEMLLVFNQCLLIALRPKHDLQIVCVENFELLYWLEFIDLFQRKPLHVNHKLAKDISTQILDYGNLIIAKSILLG